MVTFLGANNPNNEIWRLSTKKRCLLQKKLSNISCSLSWTKILYAKEKNTRACNRRQFEFISSFSAVMELPLAKSHPRKPLSEILARERKCTPTSNGPVFEPFEV